MSQINVEIVNDEIIVIVNEVQPGDVTEDGAQTLTNKTINAADNTIIGLQPLDADLTAIAALTGATGLLKKTAANTWVLDTTEYGYLGIPQNSKSANYTCVLTDAGDHILHPSADTTARTFTIPANSSVPYPIGTAITFVNQNGAGVVTIAITTDTMRLAGAGTTGSRTLAANGVATALKIAATEWIISGGGLT